MIFVAKNVTSNSQAKYKHTQRPARDSNLLPAQVYNSPFRHLPRAQSEHKTQTNHCSLRSMRPHEHRGLSACPEPHSEAHQRLLLGHIHHNVHIS